MRLIDNLKQAKIAAQNLHDLGPQRKQLVAQYTV
jgi:hypothetical protein